MQGFTATAGGILLLSLVLVPFVVSGVNISPDMSPEYADVQSFHSIDDASLALYEGQNALQNGQYEVALAAYTNATELDPSWVAAWYLKAYSLTKLNRTAEALVAVDKALVLDPSDRDSNNLKADILTQLGRGNEAAQYRKTIPAVSASPGTSVPVTTVKKSPVNPVTLITSLLGIGWIAGKYAKPAGRREIREVDDGE
jgi:Tfp pilus assembly protein PilF